MIGNWFDLELKINSTFSGPCSPEYFLLSISQILGNRRHRRCISKLTGDNMVEFSVLRKTIDIISFINQRGGWYTIFFKFNFLCVCWRMLFFLNTKNSSIFFFYLCTDNGHRKKINIKTCKWTWASFDIMEVHFSRVIGNGQCKFFWGIGAW